VSGRASGAGALIYASAALILWALHFSLIYMATAVVCTRGLSAHRLSPSSPLSVLIIGASMLALLVMLGLALRAWRQWKTAPPTGARRFLAMFALSTMPIAVLGIAWATVPVLLVEPCA
jgi:hypothetical protein